MNKVILVGRLTRDPNVTYSQGERQTAVARFTLAVDRRRSRAAENNGQEQTANMDASYEAAIDDAKALAEKVGAELLGKIRQ